MLLKEVFVFCLQIGSVFLYSFSKPVPEKIWSKPCVAGEKVLNDCNWCTCNTVGQFKCTARVCSEIDMFGHFNDAIREYIVGMEGHGAWRSKMTSCEPGITYNRPGLLCVCDRSGAWPNPVCRDFFRVLYEIEVAEGAKPSKSVACKRHDVYLFDCNVCICPSSGKFDPDKCTKRNCSDEPTPFSEKKQHKDRSEDNEIDEIYANCDLNRKYKMGCQKCVCLKNNRLLCDKCKNEYIPDKESLESEEQRSICAKYKPNQIFNMDCNTCTCDLDNNIYCTARRCLKANLKPTFHLSKSEDMVLSSESQPIDDLSCKPGTKYKSDCNTCYCTETDKNEKILSCSMKSCRPTSLLNNLVNECVENTVYESNCLICRCEIVDGVKRESCLVESRCNNDEPQRNVRLPTDLNSLHGYCEPFHIYQKDCNKCRCLPNGKVLKCKSQVCNKSEEPVVVDIIPVTQKGSKPCPKNHMYSVDCNFCFCLSTGNLLCTTAKCES